MSLIKYGVCVWFSYDGVICLAGEGKGKRPADVHIAKKRLTLCKPPVSKGDCELHQFNKYTLILSMYSI